MSGTLAVRIGRDQRGSFDPLPELQQGQLVWTKHGRPVSAGLVEGQKIGLPIHWMAADGLWSLAGEIMFSTRPAEDGREVIFFQEVWGDCRPRVPAEGPGLELDELAAMIAACGADSAAEAQERRAEMLAYWTSRPEYYMAPQCLSPYDLCDRQGNCSDEGLICRDGLCREP